MKHLILALLMSTSPAAAQTIEDFSGSPAARWDFFSDQVMGGVSQGQVTITSEGLHLTGEVSTENNGGFIQARLKTPLPDGTTAIALRVKGNGARYYLHLRTRGTLLPWRFWQAGFDTTGGWQEVTLPLSAFKPQGGARGTLTAGNVGSLAVVAYGANYSADLRVSDIRAE